MNDGRKYWLDNPRNVTRICWVLYVLCALLFAGDAFYHKHAEFSAEHIFGFYALFGFAAYVGLIFTAKGLRKLIMRKEDYYD